MGNPGRKAWVSMALLFVGMEGALVERRGKGYFWKACWIGWFHLKDGIEMVEGSCRIDIEVYLG